MVVKTKPLSVVEALEGIIKSKDEFIVYLQDDIAYLRAQLKEEKPERVRVESDFKSNRGYRSVHTRIREQVLANKRRHELVISEEEKAYETVEVE